MAYCTAAQVQSEFKDVTFSTMTAVTSAEVGAFIAQADAEIDSKLSLKYATPITGTNSLLMLQMISVLLVKARILSILKVKTGDAKTEQGGETSLAKAARDMLQSMVEGKIQLIDAVLLSSGNGVRSYNVDNSYSQLMNVEEDQW